MAPKTTGLTTDEARRRLTEFGPNDAAPACHGLGPLDLLLLLFNPLAILLLIASGVSAFLGEGISAAVIVTIVLLGAGINFLQTFRSQRWVDRLRAQVAPTATVLRDGQWQEIHRHDVVPGDIIRLSAGDLVPADARLIESRDLYVQQAALTGESVPAEKEAIDSADTKAIDANAPNMVFLGTSVISGTAMALVVATGSRTAFGDIFQPIMSTRLISARRRYGTCA